MNKKDLNNCCVCGDEPVSYTSNVSALGGCFSSYTIECACDGDQSSLPFFERFLCVYGSNEEEAGVLWNQLNNPGERRESSKTFQNVYDAIFTETELAKIVSDQTFFIEAVKKAVDMTQVKRLIVQLEEEK